MAGDWIQKDTNLRGKAEFIRLVDIASGLDAFQGIPDWAIEHAVEGILMDLWSWVDSSTDDGFFPGLTARSLTRKHGACPEFWEAMSSDEIRWLDITADGIGIPGFETRFSQGAKRRLKDAKRKAESRTKDDVRNVSASMRTETGQDADLQKNREQKNREETEISVQSSVSAVDKDFPEGGKTWSQAQHDVTLESVSDVAEELFRQARYTGNDGGIFWQAAAVLEAVPGDLTRAKLNEAAASSRNSKRAPPAYFRGAMRRMCPDFEDRLKQVWIEPRWPKQSPAKITAQAMGEFHLKRPPKEKPPDTPGRENVLATIRALERAEVNT